jgi:hypothetical protein
MRANRKSNRIEIGREKKPEGGLFEKTCKKSFDGEEQVIVVVVGSGGECPIQ